MHNGETGGANFLTINKLFITGIKLFALHRGIWKWQVTEMLI